MSLFMSVLKKHPVPEPSFLYSGFSAPHHLTLTSEWHSDFPAGTFRTSPLA